MTWRFEFPEKVCTLHFLLEDRFVLYKKSHVWYAFRDVCKELGHEQSGRQHFKKSHAFVASPQVKRA